MHNHDEAGTASKLDIASLAHLPESVARPGYARDALSAGILHFGPGNFHKAHQAVFIDQLMNEGVDLDWGIVGASVMPNDARLREIMQQQDFLTTVVTQSATVSEAQIIGPMIDYLPVGDGKAIVSAMADPAIRIVSLTLTEGGYFVNAASGEFDKDHPAICADVTGFDNPQTVFGLIVKALAHRRAQGNKAFTIMSCDNLPHNGLAARKATIGLAKMIDESLAAWIDEHASFPNGMVDRITPATGDHERTRVAALFGIKDQSPVFCEDYIQWVLEDDFVAGRPSFERAGVQIVDDVAPFEMMKIRILNGGHAILAYPAALLGIKYAHEAVQDNRIRAFLSLVLHQEVLPVVPEVPGINLAEYCDSVLRRFANPAIADTIARLCMDGSNRQPKFVIPTMADRLATHGSIEGLALASAFWCRYCQGSDESGNVIELNDPSLALLQAKARESVHDPVAWLGMQSVYGSLGDNPVFQTAFAEAIEGVRSRGVEQMLAHYCETSS